jgi:hypothetical protein
MAQWDPNTVAEAQLTDWNNQAAILADSAAKAATDLETAKTKVNGLLSEINRLTIAATKLAATNETAANIAADRALNMQAELEDAQAELADAQSWADETRASAEQAETKVAQGRATIEQAKREQARALQAKEQAETRLHERERVAGINQNLNGGDIALNALKANAAKAKQDAASANLRSNVLNKGNEADAAIKAALAEVDGPPKGQTLAEKLAALNTKR